VSSLVEMNSNPEEAARPRAARRQISLRTLLLLTAAVAVWIAHAKNRYDNGRLSEQIAAMRPLARELAIEDPAQFAVVKNEERWYDQNDWKVHLPPGDYELSLATRDVVETGVTPALKSVPLPAGLHEIAIEKTRADDKTWRVVVTVDGQEALRADEPADWDLGHGSSGGGLHSLSTQQPADAPLILFRRRFSVPQGKFSYSAPQGPCNGILLWIEPKRAASSEGESPPRE
jgi:hypothetical protein